MQRKYKTEMMRGMKAIVWMAALLGGLCGASAADRAGDLLRGVSDGFRAMKSYAVRFEVATADYRSSGSYVVEGEAYSLELGDAEVFCDGKVRYEVDNGRREVTILDVDRRSRNILNNPVRAFDFIGSDYSCELLWERDGQAAVRLTPMAGSDSSAGEITLVVDTSRMRPVSLSYDYDGERVDVRSARWVRPMPRCGASTGRPARATSSSISGNPEPVSAPYRVSRGRCVPASF